MSNCQCSCEMGLEPTFTHVRIVIARKEHECIECKEAIYIGQQFEMVRGHWEDIGHNWHATCIPCQSIRDTYCECYVYGKLKDVLWDCLGFDYVTGQTSEEVDNATPKA